MADQSEYYLRFGEFIYQIEFDESSNNPCFKNTYIVIILIIKKKSHSNSLAVIGIFIYLFMTTPENFT